MIGFKYLFLSLFIIKIVVGFHDDLFTDSDFDDDVDEDSNSFTDALFDLAGDVVTTGAHMFTSFIQELGDQIERCEFSCPNFKTPKHRTNYKPDFNGCGSYGYTIDFKILPGFTSCCNVHDICYGTCNKMKLDCDGKFKKCLLNVCDNSILSSFEELNDIKSACNSTATLMYNLVRKFGCPAYGASQKKACDCS